MKKAYSIRWQLTIICILLVAVPVVALGLISVRSSEKEINAIIEERMKTEVQMIAQNISTEAATNRKRVELAMTIAHDELYAEGVPVLDSDEQMEVQATNQITQEMLTVRVPAMKIAGKKIASNFEIVDRIQKLTGGTATVFQIMPGGALRISTNVLKSDGTRALNTFIPTDSPVYKKVMQGETFYGRAFVVKNWCQTAYEPIMDKTGRVVGMLYVGVEDTSYAVLNELSKMVIGKTGYVFVLNEKGDYVLSHKRERDGENIMNAQDARGNLFVKEMVENGMKLNSGEAGLIQYPWKNKGETSARMKISSYVFFPEWGWIIGTGAYLNDFYDGVEAIKMTTLAIAALAIGVGMLLAFFFARNISRPVHRVLAVIKSVALGDLQQKARLSSSISELNDMSENIDGMVENLRATVKLAERVAEGDLTMNVAPLSDRDALGHAIKIMVAKLSGMLSEIGISAGNVSAGAEQMSATAQAMSQGATEQAGSIEEITSSMQEITSQVRQNAENATQANRLADEARASAEKGNGQVSEMVVSMKGINESSRSISRIIKVIDEIAFQTNLLALNAAVEAARAGRHGKGFAVVAEEVRNLAARSAKAAKETSVMIEEAVRKIESGTSMADKTAEALQEIVTAARKVTDLIGEIAAASSEQSHGIAQISQGLSQIDQVTQQNTAHAEESSSAAEELASQSMILQQYVSMFKVTEAQMSRHQQAGYTERIPSRLLEPVLQQARIMQNRVAVGNGHGNGNGGNGQDKGNGKPGWGGVPQTVFVPPREIELEDRDFGKY